MDTPGSRGPSPRPPAPAGHPTTGAFAFPQAPQVLGLPKANAAPVSHDVVAIGFGQPIAATDPLRTGTYSTTLTFTLSTTSP